MLRETKGPLLCPAIAWAMPNATAAHYLNSFSFSRTMRIVVVADAVGGGVGSSGH